MLKLDWICLALLVLSVLLSLTSLISVTETAPYVFNSGGVNVIRHPSGERPLSVLKADWAQCRDRNGMPSDEYWLVLHVRNTNDQAAVKGTGVIRTLNPAGQVIGDSPFGMYGPALQEPDRHTQYYLTVPAASDTWLMVPEELTQRLSVAAPGGAANHVQLASLHLNWIPLDGSESMYEWQSTLVSHSASSDAHPRHSAKLEVANEGQRTMFEVTVFGLVYNSAGSMVDILWSEEPGRWPSGFDLRVDERRLVTIDSISRTGSCLGEADADGYTLHYWVSAQTSTGLPLVHPQVAILP